MRRSAKAVPETRLRLGEELPRNAWFRCIGPQRVGSIVEPVSNGCLRKALIILAPKATFNRAVTFPVFVRHLNYSKAAPIGKRPLTRVLLLVVFEKGAFYKVDPYVSNRNYGHGMEFPHAGFNSP
jgi:hypothetical protein